MKSNNEISNLDFLRAIAVLLVLVFHLLRFFGAETVGHFSLSEMGLLGVLFFFVHTCLVLMFSLERQTAKTGDAKLFTGFMIRRIFRIYPLSVAAVLVIYFLKIPLGHLAAHQLSSTSLGAGGVLSNLLLSQNLTNTISILGPLWSLPYEIQMYIFLPGLFLLARRIRSVWPLVGLWVLFVGVGLAHARFGHMPDLVKYIPCFLPGIMAYKLWGKVPAKWSFYGWAALIALLCVTSTIFYTPVVGWITCLALGLLVPRFAEMTSPLLKRGSHLIAKYSYGIYLSHYFCIWLAFQKLGGLPAVAQWLIFLVTAITIPVALFHGIEQPMIHVGSNVANRLLAPRPQPAALVGETVNS